MSALQVTITRFLTDCWWYYWCPLLVALMVLQPSVTESLDITGPVTGTLLVLLLGHLLVPLRVVICWPRY